MRGINEDEEMEGLEHVFKQFIMIAIILIAIFISVAYFGFNQKKSINKETDFKESTHYKCDTIGIKTEYIKY